MDKGGTEFTFSTARVDLPVDNQRALIERLTPESHLAVLCDHGRSRSKYLARILDGLGYEHTRAFGVNNTSYPPDKEKIEELVGADVIIATMGDVKAMARKLLQNNATREETEACLRKMIEIPIPEWVHWALSAPIESVGKMKRQAALDLIKTLVLQAGFKDVHENLKKEVVA